MFFSKKVFLAIGLVSSLLQIGFVEGQTTLSLGAPEDWMPYSSSKAQNGGMLVMIAKAAFSAAGYGSTYEFPPWARVMSDAANGTLSGVIGAWYSAEREKDFLYSNPIMKNEIVFFAYTSQNIKFKELKDLAPYTIGAVRGNEFIDTLTKAGLKVDLATDGQSNMEKFAAKRFDILVDEKLATQAIINSSFPNIKDQIQILQPPLESNNLYLIVSKKLGNANDLITAFNKGLDIIGKDGTLTKIYSSSGF